MITRMDWSAPEARTRVELGHYSTPQVATMTGATYRQLDYWCRIGLIRGQPAGSHHGSGHPRRWTDDQVHRVRLLRIASRLNRAPVSEVLAILERVGVLDIVDRQLRELEAGSP